MQPFPTAFWKTLGREAAPPPDSCMEFETCVIADYTAETINTNKNDGSASYWNEPGNVLQTPFVQLDRIDERNISKEKFIKGEPHDDLGDNGECQFESREEDVDGDTIVDRLDGYTPVSFLADLFDDSPPAAGGLEFKDWNTKNPICELTDGPSDCYERYVNVIAKSFLYVWMRGTPPLKPDPITGDPTYTNSIHKATHRSNPFEASKSEDCKSCTIKLWFEKDGGQKAVELIGSLDYPVLDGIGQLQPSDTDQFIQEFGYNGYRSPNGALSDHHYFYRQKATSKVTVTIGSPKTLTISIKGLGMDSNLDILDIYLDPDKRIREVLLGYYTPKIDDEENIISNVNLKDAEDAALEDYDLYNGFRTSRGDLQTLTIDHTVNNITTPIIKAMAPQLGVYRVEGDENYYKGPVRIFKWDPTKIQYWKDGEEASTGAYAGVGTTTHPINGLGYILADKFAGDNPLQAIRSGNSPYGTDYGQESPNSSQFYKASNDQPGNFSSPYTYEHQVSLGVGEHSFDLVFDSIVNYMNGGAYYDVTFTLED